MLLLSVIILFLKQNKTSFGSKSDGGEMTNGIRMSFDVGEAINFP